MTLLSFIIALVAVGVVLWVINKYVPMQEQVKKILNVLVILILVVWVLVTLGVFDAFSGVKVPRIG